MRDGKPVDQKIIDTALATTRYDVSVTGPGELIFSERFDPSWKAKIHGETVASHRTRDGYNSFVLTQTGMSTVEIYFEQESVYTYGRWISFIVLIIVVVIWVLAGRWRKVAYET